MSIVAPPATAQARLQQERNIWMATVRPDGRPHLVPIWFLWHDSRIYLCMSPQSVKARNLGQNPHIALSLEDGSHVLICEGRARAIARPWSEPIIAGFQEKYAWQIDADADYGHLVAVTPSKWLHWQPE